MEAKNQNDVVGAIYKLPLNYLFWRTISNSGDMKAIKDLDVIYAVSEAWCL